MDAALCAECRNFLQSNHDDRRHRFQDSPEQYRHVAQLLRAADTGCYTCGAIVNKFSSLQPYLLSVAQSHSLSAKFCVVIRPYGNITIDWDELADRPFLLVSILQQTVEFRLWQISHLPAEERALHDVQNIGSETSFLRAAVWLQECMDQHSKCNNVNGPQNWAPSRLLELGLEPLSPDIVQLKQTIGWQFPVKYVALSHCWGARQPMKLLRHNLCALLNEIFVAELPKLFQEAIYATRKLGIRYLWIDSLCIIQDSIEDWNIESLSMQRVYGGCILNIAAAASDDCTGSLFSTKSSPLQPRVISVGSSKDALVSRYHLWDQSLWDAEVEAAKLNTRAWVMQERMLSPRTLIFARKQLFWECRCKRACEEFPFDFPIEMFDKWQRVFAQPCLDDKLKVSILNQYADNRHSNQTRRLSLAWHNLVMLYSSLNMTFEKDKLVAVSGLAMLFAEQMEQNYFAGLWSSTLLGDLLWETNANKRIKKKPLSYRAPSWSWASVECPVKYLPGWINVDKATVLEINVQNESGSSQWGRVTNGQLRIRGKLYAGFAAVLSANEWFLQKSNALIASCMPDERPDLTNAQSKLFCLPIGSFFDSRRAMGGRHCEFRGLVLSQENHYSRGHYKRWGIFEGKLSAFFSSSFNQAPVECYVDTEVDTIVIF